MNFAIFRVNRIYGLSAFCQQRGFQAQKSPHGAGLSFFCWSTNWRLVDQPDKRVPFLVFI